MAASRPRVGEDLKATIEQEKIGTESFQNTVRRLLSTHPDVDLEAPATA